MMSAQTEEVLNRRSSPSQIYFGAEETTSPVGDGYIVDPKERERPTRINIITMAYMQSHVMGVFDWLRVGSVSAVLVREIN